MDTWAQETLPGAAAESARLILEIDGMAPSRFTGRWATINRMNMTRHSKPQSSAALAAAKLRLLAQLANRFHSGAGSGAITPRPCGAAVPLSFAQEHLWFLQQWEPASAVYRTSPALGTSRGRLTLRCLTVACSVSCSAMKFCAV